MNLTHYEAFNGSKPSIQHFQPVSREWYIRVLYQIRMDGKRSSPREQRAIVTRYTNIHHHYRVFLPDTKLTIGSADIFFPPLKSQGATPMINQRIDCFLTPLGSTTPSTSVEYTYTHNVKTSHSMWREWMDKNPQEADDMCDNGHPTIHWPILANLKERKRDRYLCASYESYQANNMAYREASPKQVKEAGVAP